MISNWDGYDWILAFVVVMAVAMLGNSVVMAVKTETAHTACKADCYPSAIILHDGRCICELGDGLLVEVHP